MADRPADRRHAPRWLLDAVFVALLALYVASGRETVPFHGDESTFVWMSRDFHTLAVEGRPDALRFDPSPREPLAQWLRVLNGSLAPMAIGLAWHAAGFTVGDLNRPWVWIFEKRPPEEQWRVNVAAGRLPEPELLRWARLPSTLWSAASVALVFAIAAGVAGTRIAGWTAAAAYATTPALLLDGRRAMQEGGLLFFTALLVWVALRVLRRGSQAEGATTPVGGLLVLALATGCAVAAKHSAAVVAAAAWIAIACAPWLRSAPRAKSDVARHVGVVLGAGIASLAVFTALVPVWSSLARSGALAALALLGISLRRGVSRGRRRAEAGVACALLAFAFVADPGWPADTAAQAAHLVAERQELLREQAARFAPESSWSARVATLTREAFGAEPRFYEDPDWGGFPEIERQIAAYHGSFVAGRPDALRVPFGLLLAVGCALGGLALARRPRDPATLLLAAWLLLPALALLANPLPWPRYYLVLHAPIAVFAGLGTTTLWPRASIAP